jgi:hypothetical protein
MARSRRTQGRGAEGEDKPIVRALPEVCPVCGESPAHEDTSTHLQGHAPSMACPNCGTQHVGWKIDWDLVKYPRPDVSLFYCNPCGKYGSIEVSSQE